MLCCLAVNSCKFTGHPRSQNVNNRKVNGVQQTQTLPMVHCGLHALEVTDLKCSKRNDSSTGTVPLQVLV